MSLLQYPHNFLLSLILTFFPPSQTPPNQTNRPLPLLPPGLIGLHRRGKSGSGRDLLVVERQQLGLGRHDDVSVLEVGVFEHVLQHEESHVGGNGLDEGEVLWEGCFEGVMCVDVWCGDVYVR